ncbi:MAG: hypothetical protein K2X01_06095 [Cyanobacteria bacterium]|nr:hypothetical protein [Cyanobacteriota bacterium]
MVLGPIWWIKQGVTLVKNLIFGILSTLAVLAIVVGGLYWYGQQWFQENNTRIASRVFGVGHIQKDFQVKAALENQGQAIMVMEDPKRHLLLMAMEEPDRSKLEMMKDATTPAVQVLSMVEKFRQWIRRPSEDPNALRPKRLKTAAGLYPLLYLDAPLGGQGQDNAGKKLPAVLLGAPYQHPHAPRDSKTGKEKGPIPQGVWLLLQPSDGVSSPIPFISLGSPASNKDSCDPAKTATTHETLQVALKDVIEETQLRRSLKPI